MQAKRTLEQESAPEAIATADPADFNVDTIAKLELQALHERTIIERISDTITYFIGSMKFFVIHVVLVAAWVIVNVNFVPGVTPFDPFPFGILTLIVSAEAIFLTIFVLISQNRMSRQAERRNQLDLQISMLAEQELTMILRMQQKLCNHFGINFGPIEKEAERYMKNTNVQRVMKELEEKLPDTD